MLPTFLGSARVPLRIAEPAAVTTSAARTAAASGRTLVVVVLSAASRTISTARVAAVLPAALAGLRMTLWVAEPAAVSARRTGTLIVIVIRAGIATATPLIVLVPAIAAAVDAATATLFPAALARLRVPLGVAIPAAAA